MPDNPDTVARGAGERMAMGFAGLLLVIIIGAFATFCFAIATSNSDLAEFAAAVTFFGIVAPGCVLAAAYGFALIWNALRPATPNTDPRATRAMKED